MKKETASAKNRFAMVKARHKETLRDAVEKNLADEQLVPLCEFISGTRNFFTSSGCAGRIILIQLPKGESKKDASFHRRWHRQVSFSEVREALREKTKGELWLKMEPFILHIGASTLENAGKILDVMHKAGVKRGGIIVAKPGKFLVELQGTQEMDAPLKKAGKVLVSDPYLRFLVKKASHKMRRNAEMLARFEKECKAALA